MSKRKLEQLRMLADWQLKQLGYDPTKITLACLAMEDAERAIREEEEADDN